MAFTNVTFQNAATATGNGTALTTEITDSMFALFVQVSGISGDTITFEASLDGGTTYSPIEMVSSAGKATTATADGLYRLPYQLGVFSGFRCRISTYGAGTITAEGTYG